MNPQFQPRWPRQSPAPVPAAFPRVATLLSRRAAGRHVTFKAPYLHPLVSPRSASIFRLGTKLENATSGAIPFNVPRRALGVEKEMIDRRRSARCDRAYLGRPDGAHRDELNVFQTCRSCSSTRKHAPRYLLPYRH